MNNTGDLYVDVKTDGAKSRFVNVPVVNDGSTYRIIKLTKSFPRLLLGDVIQDDNLGMWAVRIQTGSIIHIFPEGFWREECVHKVYREGQVLWERF